MATVANWRWFAVFLLLAAAQATRADEPPATDKVILNNLQERPKLDARDPLLFFHENLGWHNRSNSCFAVRADFREFYCYNEFTRRQSPYVAGIKASFTF